MRFLTGFRSCFCQDDEEDEEDGWYGSFLGSDYDELDMYGDFDDDDDESLASYAYRHRVVGLDEMLLFFNGPRSDAQNDM